MTFFRELTEIFTPVARPEIGNLKAVLAASEMAVNEADRWMKLTHSCQFCNDIMIFNENSLEEARSKLSEIHYKYHCKQ